MEITPLGDSALIVHVVDQFAADPNASLNKVLTALRSIEAARIPGVIDLAPAYATIGVFYDPARIEAVQENLTPFDVLQAKIQDVLSVVPKKRKKEPKQLLVEIPVCYGGEFGPDLAEVARHAGIDEADVIRRHARATYRVACVGFVPGFPFLSGLPPELTTPRRTTPRKVVPAGSVGIGGAQTGIYPSKSPGGWNLIGRTPWRLFDVQRQPASLLRAGDRVRFRQISRKEFDSL